MSDTEHETEAVTEGFGSAGVPEDKWGAFAWFVSRCAEGVGRELLAEGKTKTQARNAIIHCLLDFAAGEACRVAREEGREPDKSKWLAAVDAAFDRAVTRTSKTTEGL